MLCQPEMDIQLTSGEPVLSETQLQNCNFASMTAGSMFSAPDSWTVSNASGYNYVAAMSLPISADVMRTFIRRLVVRQCLDRPWTDRKTDTQVVRLSAGLWSTGRHVWSPGMVAGDYGAVLSRASSAELDMGRVHPRVGSGQVGSSPDFPYLVGRVGSIVWVCVGHPGLYKMLR